MLKRNPKRPVLVPAVLVLTLILCFAHAVSAQPAAPASATLTVDGEIAHPQTFDESVLAAMPQVTVHVTTEKGVPATYTGVPLSEILERAGAPLGKALRGKQMTLYLIVTASDGYRALFALAELDPAYTDKVVILADRRDGHPLDASEGPLRFVVPGEKRHARWVRGVTTLSVRRAN
ncbi:MAG: molybdopterin-dependent oxidoreductase [Candidatus Binataceae bacterium]